MLPLTYRRSMPCVRGACYPVGRMTWVAKTVVVLVAPLILFNAQCLAACAVQPCHRAAHKPASQGDEASQCHQKPGGNQSKDKPPGCSHESVTSDGAKKANTDPRPIVSVALLINQDTFCVHVTHEPIVHQPRLLHTVPTASKTVLRI